MTSRVVAKARCEVDEAVVLEVSGGLHVFQLGPTSLKSTKWRIGLSILE